MAAIDSCFIDNWKDYCDFRDFLKGKKFKTPRGVEIDLSYLVYDCWKEDDFKDENGNPQERKVFNSPVYIDNWLYHNCNLPCIQEWLKSRYLEGGYCKGCPEDITEDLKIPEYEPCTKVKVIRKGLTRHGYGFWSMDVSMPDPDYPEYRNYLHYNEDHDFWVLPYENDVWTISGPFLRISVRAIIRKILKKWKLPKGCKIELQGRYRGDKWILETR